MLDRLCRVVKRLHYFLGVGLGLGLGLGTVSAGMLRSAGKSEAVGGVVGASITASLVGAGGVSNSFSLVGGVSSG